MITFEELVQELTKLGMIESISGNIIYLRDNDSRMKTIKQEGDGYKAEQEDIDYADDIPYSFVVDWYFTTDQELEEDFLSRFKS